MLYSIVYLYFGQGVLSILFNYLHSFFKHTRPAFSYKATHLWFIVVFVGFLMRTDTFGVTSIVRGLSLSPNHYTSILNFFHSSAWSVETLMNTWWGWLKKECMTYCINDRLIIAGDHTKVAKDGRYMPAVTTLHQDSETGSKPSYFRGHHWGCISIVEKMSNRFFSIPLIASVQEGLENIDHEDEGKSKTTWIVEMAIDVAKFTGIKSILILDAYFSVGPVFEYSAKHLLEGEQLVHILVRAKKNITAYLPAISSLEKKRGAPKKYGDKLKLMSLFDSNLYDFSSVEAEVYGEKETIKYLCLNLLWKPIKSKLRFILVENSRGRIILISSDLTIDPAIAIELYCRRITIETMFHVLKNIVGGLQYHFWSSYLKRASRSPVKKELINQSSSNNKKTLCTLAAIEKFVNIQLLVIGMLQLISMKFREEVLGQANCWMRTINKLSPSEFLTKTALQNVLKSKLSSFSNNAIIQLIQGRMAEPFDDREEFKKTS